MSADDLITIIFVCLLENNSAIFGWREMTIRILLNANVKTTKVSDTSLKSLKFDLQNIV